MKCSRLGVTLVVWCVTMAAGWTALPAHAQQFVLVDVEYTATSANTMDSHYRVMPKAGIPANWRSPVNYANGKVYVELEVLEKPGTKNTLYNICIENPSNPACLPYMMYTAKGKYKANFNFMDFWQYADVDWTKGCSEVSLILKDDTETKQQGNAEFYPYKAHVVLTVVAPGGTYVPPGAGAAGSPAAGSGSSAGKSGSGGSSASAGKSGSGGTSASSAGKDGSGGMSASNPAKGGSGGASGSTTAKGGSGGVSAADPKANGGSGGKASSEPSGSGGSAAAKGGDEGSAGTLGNQVGNDHSVTSQLESSGGCSTAGSSTTGASWFMLGLALLLRRRRS